MKLYPPNGKNIPVDAHPSRVDTMKAKGWTDQPKQSKRKPKKEDDK